MQNKNEILTFGGITLALFGILIAIDRFTGGTFIATLLLLFPIPFIVYSIKYGFKNSVALLLATIVLVIFIGNPLSIFYAISEAFIGLICGTMLKNKKIKKWITAIVIILMSIFVAIASVTFLASILGNNVDEAIIQIKDTAQKIYSSFGIGDMTYDIVYNTKLVNIVFGISVIIVGIIQGVIIFIIGMIISNKYKKIKNM